jgi:hypothetical protein
MHSQGHNPDIAIDGLLAMSPHVLMERLPDAKAVFVGDSGAGKAFDETIQPTPNPVFRRLKLTDDPRTPQLQLCDTAGDEKFRAIIPMYFRNAGIPVICFAMDSPDQWGSVDCWAAMARGHAEDAKVPEFVVSAEELTQKAKSLDAECVRTSAVSGEGIGALKALIVEAAPGAHRLQKPTITSRDLRPEIGTAAAEADEDSGQ